MLVRENKVVDVSLIGGWVGLVSSPRRDSKGITALMIAVAGNQNRCEQSEPRADRHTPEGRSGYRGAGQ
jgi:hypothetical protein